MPESDDSTYKMYSGAISPLEERIKENAPLAEKKVKAIGNGIGTALMSGVTIGVTTAMISDNPMDAIGAVMKASVPSMVAAAIQAGAAVGEGFDAGAAIATGGLSLLVTAVTAVLTGAFVLAKKGIEELGKDKTKERVEELKKEVEDLEQKYKDLANAAEEAQKNTKNFTEMKKKFEELSSKIVLTTEEQEEYNELVDNIQEQLPQIVSYYDDMNNKLVVQNDLWDAIIEKESALAKKRTTESFEAEMELLKGQEDLTKAERKKNEEDQEKNIITIKSLQGSFPDGITVKELDKQQKSIAKMLGYTDEGLDQFNVIGWSNTGIKRAMEQLGYSDEQEFLDAVVNNNLDIVKYVEEKENQLAIEAEKAEINAKKMAVQRRATIENFYTDIYGKEGSGIATYLLIEQEGDNPTSREAEKFFKDLELTPEQLEIDKYIRENTGNYSYNDLYNLWAGANGWTNKEYIKGKWEELKQLQQDVAKTIGFSPEFLDNWSENQMNLLIDSLDKAAQSGTNKEKYAKVLSQFIVDNDLSPEVSQTLLSINFTDLASLEKSKDIYIKQLEEEGKSTQEATELFNKYVDTVARGTNLLAITSKVGVDAFISTLNETRKATTEISNVLTDAVKQLDESGRLSLETIAKLRENGFGDYLTTTDYGVSFNAKDAIKYQIDEIKNQSKLYDQQIGINNARTIELATEKVSLSTELMRSNLSEERKQEILDQIDLIDLTISGIKDSNISLAEMRDLIHSMDAQGIYELVSKYQEDYEKAIEDSTKAQEDYNKAIKDAEKAEKDLAKAEKERYEAYHGTGNYTGKLDELYNYQQALNKLKTENDELTKSLEKSESVLESKGILNSISENLISQKNYNAAEANVLSQAISRRMNNLSAYSQYYSSNSDGTLNINSSILNMDANDKMRQFIEEQVDLVNQEIAQRKQLLNENKEIDNENEKRLESYLNSYVSFAKTIGDIMKEQSEQEVSDLKEKYDEMKAADDDYLNALEEAIQKQRDLRDKENSYEELAQKQKKLSLLQRDTSGAMQKDILSLEKDIEKTQQDIFDKEVDDLINGIKELYEVQQEERDALIENKEAVKENTEWTKMAAELIRTWTSPEDVIAWNLANNPNLEHMSIEEIENQQNELLNSWNGGAANYLATQVPGFNGDLTTSQEQINSLIENTSVYLLENIDKTRNAILEEINEEQQNADDAVAEAIDRRNEAIKAQKDALDELTKSTQAQAAAGITAAEALETALSEMAETAKTEMFSVAKEYINNMIALGVSPEELVSKYNLNKNFVESATGGEGNYIGPRDSRIYTVTYTNGLSKKFSSIEEAKNSISNETYYVGNTSYNKSGYKYITDADGKLVASLYGLEYANGNIVYTKTAEEAEFMASKTPRYALSRIFNDEGKAYSTGGLVDYTGLALVHGSQEKPEAFLSALDTERIGKAAELLSEIPLLNSNNSYGDVVSSNIGDTSIEIHINVDSIANDYDVDKLASRIKKDIVDISRPTGTSVILNK